jgi:hypothetical protein
MSPTGNTKRKTQRAKKRPKKVSVAISEAQLGDLEKALAEEGLQESAVHEPLMVKGLAAYGRELVEYLGEDRGVEEDCVIAASSASAQAAAILLNTSPARHELLSTLSPMRRQYVERALESVTGLLTSAALGAAVSNKELEAQAQTAVDAFRVLVLGNASQLRSLVDALDPSVEDEIENEEAEARGRLRLQAMYREIIAESYSVAELSKWRLSRQRLKQLRDADKLFALEVPYFKGLLYPRWQFEPSMKPRQLMSVLIQTARESGLDAIGFHRVMTNPAAGGGTKPADLLEEGKVELVLGILKAADR